MTPFFFFKKEAANGNSSAHQWIMLILKCFYEEPLSHPAILFGNITGVVSAH